MKKELKFAPAYTGKLAFPAVLQCILGLLSSMILDCGVTFRVFFCSAVAYWVGAVMIMSRRPTNPTKTDLFVIRWGTILCFVIALLVSPLAWALRGAI